VRPGKVGIKVKWAETFYLSSGHKNERRAVKFCQTVTIRRHLGTERRNAEESIKVIKEETNFKEKTFRIREKKRDIIRLGKENNCDGKRPS